MVLCVQKGERAPIYVSMPKFYAPNLVNSQIFETSKSKYANPIDNHLNLCYDMLKFK